MTVVAVRDVDDADFVEVMFAESARFYRLMRAHPDFADALELLRTAAARGRALRIGVASIEADVIDAVGPLEPHPPAQ